MAEPEATLEFESAFRAVREAPTLHGNQNLKGLLCDEEIANIVNVVLDAGARLRQQEARLQAKITADEFNISAIASPGLNAGKA